MNNTLRPKMANSLRLLYLCVPGVIPIFVSGISWNGTTAPYSMWQVEHNIKYAPFQLNIDIINYAGAMSVRPSVCPSVCVFRTFLQHAVRYQFETWYMYSVGGTAWRLNCIKIGSLWPSLQPKVGQTFFCNHGLRNQDKFFKFGT